MEFNNVPEALKVPLETLQMPPAATREVVETWDKNSFDPTFALRQTGGEQFSQKKQKNISPIFIKMVQKSKKLRCYEFESLGVQCQYSCSNLFV